MAGILFVDDEADLRFMVSSYFEMAGHQVVTAADPAEARAVSEGVAFRAIILDVNLPGEGSASLLEFLKEHHPAATVILYTGHGDKDESVRNLLAHGASRHVFKDGSLGNLLAAVGEACA
jgi:DNA-binding NtrC family response regulator